MRYFFHQMLKFTPLEFETYNAIVARFFDSRLKFTPLEFETSYDEGKQYAVLS